MRKYKNNKKERGEPIPTNLSTHKWSFNIAKCSVISVLSNEKYFKLIIKKICKFLLYYDECYIINCTGEYEKVMDVIIPKDACFS